LPDGIFLNQKSRFGQILEGLAMEKVGIFMSIWSSLWPFDIFGKYFSHFGMLYQEKSGNLAHTM
jgi:hypothetical protein